MELDTIAAPTDPDPTDRGPSPDRVVVDVSTVTARGLEEYVRSSAACGDDVYLERKGSRTVLVAE